MVVGSSHRIIIIRQRLSTELSGKRIRLPILDFAINDLSRILQPKERYIMPLRD